MKIKNIIEVSLQRLDDVKEAVKLNEKEGNKYYIKADRFNLVHAECILYLINHGYRIEQTTAEELTFISEYKQRETN